MPTKTLNEVNVQKGKPSIQKPLPNRDMETSQLTYAKFDLNMEKKTKKLMT